MTKPHPALTNLIALAACVTTAATASAQRIA